MCVCMRVCVCVYVCVCLRESTGTIPCGAVEKMGHQKEPSTVRTFKLLQNNTYKEMLGEHSYKQNTLYSENVFTYTTISNKEGGYMPIQPLMSGIIIRQTLS